MSLMSILSEISLNSDYSFFVSDLNTVLNVIFLAAILIIVSFFIWNFYNSTSKRDVIALNLREYNPYEHHLSKKFLAIFLYLLENIVIMPFLIALWFSGLAFVLILIAKERPIGDVLLIAAAFVSAIRVLAYYKGEISKDLAKLFPFMALSIFLLSPGQFDLQSVISHIQEIPSSLTIILSYISVVFIIEIILRVLSTIYNFWISEEEAIDEKVPEIES